MGHCFSRSRWRHLDPQIAREQIQTLLACQADDGLLGHRHRPQRSSVISQPPIVAWAVEQVHEVEEDLQWLRFLLWLGALLRCCSGF